MPEGPSQSRGVGLGLLSLAGLISIYLDSTYSYPNDNYV